MTTEQGASQDEAVGRTCDVENIRVLNVVERRVRRGIKQGSRRGLQFAVISFHGGAKNEGTDGHHGERNDQRSMGRGVEREMSEGIIVSAVLCKRYHRDEGARA
jgi:hypothetical protein